MSNPNPDPNPNPNPYPNPNPSPNPNPNPNPNPDPNPNPNPGRRHSLPAFFTTEAPPTPAPWARGDHQRRGAREGSAARAAALWELGLMPRSEGDFMAFMWHWAQLFDPGAWPGEPATRTQ